jgi:hypothetical protein
MFSQARKAGIWVGLAGQTLKTINESSVAMIFLKIQECILLEILLTRQYQ